MWTEVQHSSLLTQITVHTVFSTHFQTTVKMTITVLNISITICVFFIYILLYPTLYILNLLHHPPALRSFYIWNADFPADLRGKGGGVRLSHSDQLDSWNLWLSQILCYVFYVSCLKRQFVLNSLFRKNRAGSFYTISANIYLLLFYKLSLTSNNDHIHIKGHLIRLDPFFC